MKLIRIALENYQGIKELTLDFDGSSATIYGDNGAGKTTLLNAHCWLLFGRSGSGIKGYTPKTNDPAGEYQHNLEHTAEETLQLDNGKLITLKKAYKEVWTKTRGSNAATFDRNTVDFYINGVPTKETEYDKVISEIAGGNLERLKILTIPGYFPGEMKWSDRRQMLMEICRPFSEKEIIETTPALKDLPSFLETPAEGQTYTVEEAMKIMTAAKAQINNRIRDIPGRIDDATRAIPPETVGTTADNTAKEILQLRKEKAMAEAEYIAAKKPNEVREKIRDAIRETETAMLEAKIAYNQREEETAARRRRRITDLTVEANANGDKISEKKARLAAANLNLKELVEKRDRLLSEYESASKETWQAGREVCPTCKRPLPPEEVTRLREEFNLKKSKKLEGIREDGKKNASADMITEQRNAIDNLEKIIKSLSEKAEEIKTAIRDLETAPRNPAFEEVEEGKKFIEALWSMKHKEKAEANKEVPFDEYKEKIAAAEEAINAKLKIAAAFDTKARQEARIKQLKDDETNLGKEYQRLEYGTFLCEEFMREKARLLTDEINKKFETVKFRLFVNQINGGMREDCEVMIPSPDGNLVPFSDANDAAKINAGIEIASTFSDHWGLRVPLIVDNAERITHVRKSEAQTILLKVKEGPKTIYIAQEGTAAE